ncbi:MAG: DsrE family protein [bacterium]|nr:DsrE family protein [bacterium]
MNLSKIISVGLIFLFLGFTACVEESEGEDDDNGTPTKLAVVWTSGDRDVALKMVFMYTYNAKKNGWWDDEVQLIVWGPSSKLLSEDEELQEYIKNMKNVGVEVLACKACADMYGVADKLTELGVEVKYMGQPLTDLLKDSEWEVVTF